MQAIEIEVIDDKVIEDCELKGACDSGLNWLRAKPRTLAELREHSLSWYVWLAENTTIPAVLEKLSTDSDSYVRRGVAQNANTPVAVLEKLSTDSYSYVRRGVAQNANTPVAVLEKLSTDSDSDVRYYVAQNANTPVAVLEKLSTDSDSDVRRAAKKRLEEI